MFDVGDGAVMTQMFVKGVDLMADHEPGMAGLAPGGRLQHSLVLLGPLVELFKIIKDTMFTDQNPHHIHQDTLVVR